MDPKDRTLEAEGSIFWLESPNIAVMRRTSSLLMLIIVSSSAASQADPLDRRIQAAMERDGVPGLALAVVRHGKILKLGGYGYASLEWKGRATPDTRFEIASMSKMFTGAAARLLIDEGKLNPEDPVGKYFDHLPDSWKAVKVRHLITMSTGLGEDWGTELIPYDADVTTAYDDASMVKALTTMKMKSPVGAEFHYSSPGYAMLGIIVSKLSGKPLAKFVEERIFQPAEMASSAFIDNWAVIPERAQGYRKRDGKLMRGWYLGQYLHARGDVGVMSTAKDMAKWIIALEQRKILKDPTPLWEGATSDRGRALDYAYGWMVDLVLGHRRMLHGGQYRTGFRSMIQRLPDDDLSVVVLSNCDCAPVERYAFMVVASYVRDLPDPERESAQPDPNPAQTDTMVRALKAVESGKIDETLMTPDAFDPIPIGDVAEHLRSAKAPAYAGSHRLPGAGIKMHGHQLVDYETLKLAADGNSLYLTLYRDDRGKIAYVVPTM